MCCRQSKREGSIYLRATSQMCLVIIVQILLCVIRPWCIFCLLSQSTLVYNLPWCIFEVILPWCILGFDVYSAFRFFCLQALSQSMVLQSTLQPSAVFKLKQHNCISLLLYFLLLWINLVKKPSVCKIFEKSQSNLAQENKLNGRYNFLGKPKEQGFHLNTVPLEQLKGHS